ncbi:hypothetical protein GCK72_005810 [Caenorhabditis remanei]|uniref:Uncharacterized protein n=1 Tax=Caenorhabditis remanei TaxID=31234 RepID=A0A6A5HG86_CAERE|nr:hypothetical protein GCK72_005810 [Caenorhabditis remanei]KAF1765857.1 hypothetical protein GCK72_005810 [Caenorhabditis remanei]
MNAKYQSGKISTSGDLKLIRSDLASITISPLMSGNGSIMIMRPNMECSCKQSVVESSETTIADSEGATLEIKIPSEVAKRIRIDINAERRIISVSSSGSFDKLLKGDVILRVNDEE